MQEGVVYTVEVYTIIITNPTGVCSSAARQCTGSYGDLQFNCTRKFLINFYFIIIIIFLIYFSLFACIHMYMYFISMYIIILIYYYNLSLYNINTVYTCICFTFVTFYRPGLHVLA